MLRRPLAALSGGVAALKASQIRHREVGRCVGCCALVLWPIFSWHLRSHLNGRVSLFSAGWGREERMGEALPSGPDWTGVFSAPPTLSCSTSSPRCTRIRTEMPSTAKFYLFTLKVTLYFSAPCTSSCTYKRNSIFNWVLYLWGWTSTYVALSRMKFVFLSVSTQIYEICIFNMFNWRLWCFYEKRDSGHIYLVKQNLHDLRLGAWA